MNVHRVFRLTFFGVFVLTLEPCPTAHATYEFGARVGQPGGLPEISRGSQRSADPRYASPNASAPRMGCQKQADFLAPFQGAADCVALTGVSLAALRSTPG